MTSFLKNPLKQFFSHTNFEKWTQAWNWDGFRPMFLYSLQIVAAKTRTQENTIECLNRKKAIEN